MSTSSSPYVALDRHRNRSSKAKDARMRVICFGFAGGTITSLLSLAEAFPGWIDVWGAEYPGRGMRWQRPLLDAIAPLLDDLLPGLARLSDLPVALLGYSMGAHVAYRLALKAHAEGIATPLGLVAVSARPPHRQATDWPDSASQSDEALLARLRSLGGIPGEILNNRVLMQTFMPVVRADLGLCTDMNGFAPTLLPCPVLALHGGQDRLLADAQVPRWLEVAGGRPAQSRARAYAGGHFFHKGVELQLAEDIAGWLAAQGVDDGAAPAAAVLAPALS